VADNAEGSAARNFRFEAHETKAAKLVYSVLNVPE
jgi:hypothetical protein